MPDSQDMVRRETRLGTQRRAVSTAPSTYNAENHTVEFNAATGFEVLRWGWDGKYYERLLITPEAVDLTRVEKGQCPLLDAHSRWSVDDQLGTHIAARIENGILVLTAKFSQSARGQEIEARVADKELSGTSIGYRVIEMVLVGTRDDIPIYEVTKWQLLENSLAPVPADPDSGVRSETEDLHPCFITEKRRAAMPDPVNEPAAPAAPAVERTAPVNPAPAPVIAPLPEDARMSATEALDFSAQAREFGIDEATVRGWVEGKTPDQARAELLRAAAEKQNKDSPRLQHGEGGRIGVDGRDHTRAAMIEVIGQRLSLPGEITDNGRRFQGQTLMEMGRNMLIANGYKVEGLNRRQLAQAIIGFDALHGRAHSTSDFPFIMSNTTNKILRAGYEATPQTFKTWMRRRTVGDFKQITSLQLSSAPALLEIPEGGEYQYGTMTEGREVYSLVKFGRKFGLTWEMILNDDLDAFSKVPQAFGRAAAELESDVAYAPMLSNPNMSDGNAVFSTAHGNLAASGAALAESTIEALDILMGAQTGLDGKAITVNPKYLLTGVKYRVAARKLTTATTPAAAADINAYSGILTPVIERRLNGGAGATPYFVIADYATIDTGEYCYLEGDDGVYLEERQGFDIDQIEYKARLVMASKIVDWRGMAKNPGL